MQSKIPLPTDNIFKFYALFGLLLLIASLFFFTQLISSYNDKAFDRYIKLEVLNAIEKLTSEQKARKEILETQKEIDKFDKQLYLNGISVFIALSILSMFFGFHQWHTKIQPMQDKASELSIEKLKLEIKALNKQLQRTPALTRLRR